VEKELVFGIWILLRSTYTECMVLAMEMVLASESLNKWIDGHLSGV